MIKTHGKTMRGLISHNNASPKASPNGQVPVNGKTASDDEVRRVSHEIMRRHRPLLKKLAR